MKIYRASIINHGWDGNRTFLERYYNSIEIPNLIKDKFENISKKFLLYYQKLEEDNNLNELWYHYHKRYEFLSSSCHVDEIEVFDTMFYYGKPVNNLTKKQREEYLKLGYTLPWKNS